MVQVVKMTDEEKMRVYMERPKEELCKMLIECNRIIDSVLPKIKPDYIETSERDRLAYDQAIKNVENKRSDDLIFAPWQMCPQCGGDGYHIKMSRDSSLSTTCHICSGRGIITMALLNGDDE